MSAVFGAWRRDGHPLAAALSCMSARLAHRGADGAGAWHDDAVGLGHRLYATTPESRRERQPVVGAGGALVCVADARLDDRAHLMSLLGLRAPADAAPTDAELVLAAYARWGESCVHRLLGDFAFVVWDARARTLFAARDPMGAKPFFYHCAPRLFAFASEIKGLLCLPEVPRDLDELQVALHLEGRLPDRESTFCAGIRRLPGGHLLRVDASGVATVRRYWEPDAGLELRFSSPDEYAEAFRELFTEAVRCRMRSTRPIGVALSGGLDSSSIACVARDLLSPRERPLHTFSAVFPGLPEAERRVADESEWIDAVLATGGFAPHRVHADRVGVLHDLPRVLHHFDQPPLAYNLYMTWGVYEAAREAGVGVFFEGTEGDLTVGYGFSLLVDAAHAGDWARFDHEAAALCRRYADIDLQPSFYVKALVLPHLAHLARAGEWRAWGRVAQGVAHRMPVSRLRLARTHAIRPLLPPSALHAWRRLRGTSAGGSSVLHPELRRVLRRHDASAAEEPDVHDGRAARARTFFDPLYQYMMELGDSCAAAFGLEPRYPFFDRRLIEFMVAVPEDERLRDGFTRSIIRRAMEGVLPPEVQWRVKKQDVSPGFRRGLRGRDRETLDPLLASDALSPFVDRGALDAVAARLHGPDGQQRQVDAMAAYRAAVLAAWLDCS
ncbi:MAG TPA: lasso peptide isopeptide bond-forming cyclase [Gemmatimonadales bacterium]